MGVGLGGEQPIGGTFIAEEWPEDRRKMGAGYMHTGYYFGFFLLMPWWSTIGSFKPVPDRVTYAPH